MRNNKNCFKDFFYIFTISFLLLLIYSINSDINPSVISQRHSISSIESNNGHVIKGKFIAEYDFLSMVTLRFLNPTIQYGYSIFRIKEMNEKNWIHTSNIDMTQYYIHPNYNFGFPPINNSKNRIFYFEIIADNQNNQKLTLLKNGSTLTTQYMFSSRFLLKNPFKAIIFFQNKFLYFIQTNNAWSLGIIFFIFTYWMYSSTNFKYIRNKDLRVFSLPVLWKIFYFCAAIDIFFIYRYYNLIQSTSLAIWLYCIIKFKLHPIDSIKNSLFFLLISFYFYLFSMTYIVEKSAIYFYLLFIIAIMHSLLRYFKFLTNRKI